jgi:hypothetical protein
MDNGGRPFLVQFTSSKVVVFVTDNDEDNPMSFKKKVLESSYSKKWIGDINGKYPGNSILVKVAGNKYIFIGESIQRFSLLDGDDISSYHSNVGNSGVPYPYLIGEKYTYLMLDWVAIPNSLLTLNGEIYEQYYFKFDKTQKIKVKKIHKKILHKRVW